MIIIIIRSIQISRMNPHSISSSRRGIEAELQRIRDGKGTAFTPE